MQEKQRLDTARRGPARRLQLLCIALGLALFAGGAVVVTAPAEGKASGCRDGRDNDRDGLTDANDPGCKNARDRSEIFKKGPACDNGRDDDGDGTVDVGGGKKKKRKARAAPDGGCADPRDADETGSSTVACSDGRDNEPDGLTDGDDPGCSGSSDTTETDPNGPECDNGRDDDDDALEDFRINDTGDGGCTGVADDSEFGAGGGRGNPPGDEPPGDEPPGDDPPGDDPPGDDPGDDPPAPPTLVCSPDAYDFGNVPIRESRFRDVTCIATGDEGATVTISRVTLAGSSEFSLAPGGTCLGAAITVGRTSCFERVVFRPASGSRVSTIVQFSHDGANGPERSVFSGTGIVQDG